MARGKIIHCRTTNNSINVTGDSPCLFAEVSAPAPYLSRWASKEKVDMKIERNDILTFLFWSNFAAFVAHLIDESLMGGGFVGFIQRHFWSGFAISDFFAANTIWLILIAISNILYDWRGNRFAGIPLAFVWERVFNGFFHLGSTFYFKEYSPGLVTSALFFVILYLICRYGVLRGHIRKAALFGSGIVAAIFEITFISSMWWAH